MDLNPAVCPLSSVRAKFPILLRRRLLSPVADDVRRRVKARRPGALTRRES